VLTHYLTRRRIGAYLDGALGEPEARMTAAHLTGCSRCQQEAERLQRLHGLIQQALAAPPAPDWTGLWPGVVRGIEQARRPASAAPAVSRRRFGWRPRLAVAGTLVVLAGSMFVWQTLDTRPDPEGLVVVRSARTEIPDGSLMVYASPDHDLAVVWVFSDP
jgi:anti-sigma factor RsiW